MNTLSLRDLVRNAAAVFSEVYGAVTRQAERAGAAASRSTSTLAGSNDGSTPTTVGPNWTNSTPRIGGFAIRSSR